MVPTLQIKTKRQEEFYDLMEIIELGTSQA